MRAGAKVRPEAEGDMILGPPAQIEAVRILEMGLVPVRRSQADEQQ